MPPASTRRVVFSRYRSDFEYQFIDSLVESTPELLTPLFDVCKIWGPALSCR
jgi:hypothetical protein